MKERTTVGNGAKHATARQACKGKFKKIKRIRMKYYQLQREGTVNIGKWSCIAVSL